MTSLPNFTISELLDNAVAYGHKASRWNPKMAPFIYGLHGDTHIIDLRQTAPLLQQAMEAVYKVAKKGRVLFVGTKHQASEIVAEEAKRCGQYYINHRWLGGTLTNWATISKSLKAMENLEKLLSDPKTHESYTKKEYLDMQRKYAKYEMYIGGIRQLGGLPDIIIIIDTNKEDIAVKEAKRLGIPIVAIVDTNSDPDEINYVVPGNDDASKAIRLYCRLFADSVIAGIQDGLAASGVDIGAFESISDLIAEKNEMESIEKQKANKKKSFGAPNGPNKKIAKNANKASAKARVSKNTSEGEEATNALEAIVSSDDAQVESKKATKPKTSSTTDGNKKKSPAKKENSEE